tara:strand:+ start:141 stop:263 length:123 start_codon:yes stop_codon:yes gene_type:complete
MELLIKIGFSFFLGVGIGVMLMQVSALVWMFWDMFKSKQK